MLLIIGSTMSNVIIAVKPIWVDLRVRQRGMRWSD
uniref:Uncharacterized protein n=1 Tax=Anguilla anguilla TaxID=7936 RepID=A0A0E9TLY9_ANGAN